MTTGELAPYPDELAYSVLARAVERWSYSYNSTLLRQIFDGPIPTLDHVFAPSVHRLAQALGFASTRSFAAAHTLLPFYAGFADTQSRARLLDAVSFAERASRVRLLGSSSVGRFEPPFLRVCLDCLHFDRVRYGEVYWHRAHQLPNVQSCARHGRMLHWTKTAYREQSRLALWTAAHATGPSSKFTRCVRLFSPSLTAKVEGDSLLALSTGLSHSRARDPDEYKALLHHLGYVNRFGTVDCQGLGTDFQAFARAHGCAPASLGPQEWWLTLHRDKGVEQPLPVHHIVFQQFLAEAHRSEEPLSQLALKG